MSRPDEDVATVRLLYFAWVRERIGRAEEVISLPAGVTTIAELMGHLSRRGEGYGEAFRRPEIIRAAIDRAHSRPDARIAGAREIAFFPPVTGG
jgi:molybdopterin synthase sulfur carrier subunit